MQSNIFLLREQNELKLINLLAVCAPVPTVQWQSVLIQNIFGENLSFSTDSEGFQKQLWIVFWISLNQSKIQRNYSVFLWIRWISWNSSESDKFSALIRHWLSTEFGWVLGTGHVSVLAGSFFKQFKQTVIVIQTVVVIYIFQILLC